MKWFPRSARRSAHPHLQNRIRPRRLIWAVASSFAGLLIVGCDSSEKQAVREAEQAIAFYLPQLLDEPALTNRPVTLSGEGFQHPAWNISGGHYLWGQRTVLVGAKTRSFNFYIMHPRQFARFHDPGTLVTNNPALTGLTNVGALKLIAQNRIFVAHAGVRAD